MIGKGAEASTTVRAEAADFFCDCWAVKMPSDERVGDVPRSVHYHAQGIGLEYFQDFDVGGGSSAPEKTPTAASSREDFRLSYKGTLTPICHYL
jgi:hypothetical protein